MIVVIVAVVTVVVIVPLDTSTTDAIFSGQLFAILAMFFKDKSRNLFKFVSVLLSASVERVGVSRVRDFLGIN